MLELREVSRTVGREALLARASLSFTPGAPTAVLGLSPAGRAAFLRLLAGADRPESGTIRLNGREIGQVRRSPGEIALIDGAGAKLSGRSVRKALAEGLRGGKGGRRESEAAIVELASAVRLGGRMDTLVKDLDLDQRIRLAIAAARGGRPSLILLNAPAAKLEPEIQERFVSDLSGMLAGESAVVVAAGGPEDAFGLGGRVIVLDRGVVVQEGDVAEVFARPCSLAVALATSRPVINTLTLAMRGDVGRMKDGSTFQAPAGVVLPHEGACTLAFRPDDVRLQRGDANCVRFVARAAGEETIGGRRYARLSFADATWLTPQHGVAFPNGAILNAFVDRQKLLVFDADGQALVKAA